MNKPQTRREYFPEGACTTCADGQWCGACGSHIAADEEAFWPGSISFVHDGGYLDGCPTEYVPCPEAEQGRLFA